MKFPLAFALGSITLSTPAMAIGTVAPLAADDLQRVGRGEVVFNVEDPGRGDRQIRFLGKVNGNPDLVFDTLASYDLYATVLSAYFTESRVRSSSGNQALVLFRFRTYFPFPDRHVVTRYSKDPDRHTINWWRVGGNVRKNDGTVVVRPYGANQSIVDFRVAVDPGIPFIPHWVFEWAERQVVPGVVTELDRYVSNKTQVSHR